MYPSRAISDSEKCLFLSAAAENILYDSGAPQQANHEENSYDYVENTRTSRVPLKQEKSQPLYEACESAPSAGNSRPADITQSTSDTMPKKKSERARNLSESGRYTKMEPDNDRNVVNPIYESGEG